MTVTFLKYIDFNQSFFEVSRYFLGEKSFLNTNLQFKSIEEMKLFAKGIPSDFSVNAEKVVFQKGFQIPDIFCLRHPINQTIISERLKTALEKSKVKGIRILPLDFEIIQQ